MERHLGVPVHRELFGCPRHKPLEGKGCVKGTGIHGNSRAMLSEWEPACGLQSRRRLGNQGSEGVVWSYQGHWSILGAYVTCVKRLAIEEGRRQVNK